MNNSLLHLSPTPSVPRGHASTLSHVGGWLLVAVASLVMTSSAVANGVVIAWGSNSDGQRAVPAGLSNVVGLAAGAQHSVALRADGQVVGWGNNSQGQLTVPPGVTNVTVITAGFFHTAALQADGTVAAWGYQATPPPGLSNVVALSGGWEHTLALRADGTVVAWGTPSTVPAGLSNVIAVAAGYGHSLALRQDGTVYAWGENSYNRTNVPPGLANVVAIAAGAYHSLALRADGRVIAWGADYSGQATVPAGATNVISLGAGAAHSLAVLRGGTVVGWGAADFGQSHPPTALSNVLAVAGGVSHSLALQGNGAPFVTVPPAPLAVTIGKEGLFRVFAAGAAPLSYQWRFAGGNLAGATRSTLTLANVQASQAGLYEVVVSNAFGLATSAPARLTPVPELPVVVTPPQPASTLCGEGADFDVTADGSPPFRYQWLFENAPLPGATQRVLALTRVAPGQAGLYAVVVSNAFGAITSAPAMLEVVPELPRITSPLIAAGKQGAPFAYTITGLHFPTGFDALGLPEGLAVDTASGSIMGAPTEPGEFAVLLTSASPCGVDEQVLSLTVTSSVPVITSALTAAGIEGVPFGYQIEATDAPTSFGATGLPPGLRLDAATGALSGTTVYGGAFNVTLSASNQWGVGTAVLALTLEYAQLGGLSITDVSYTYSSPYLLDFQFSMRDDDDPEGGHAVVVDPKLLTVVCQENNLAISALETGSLVQRGSAKLFKAYLVLDFTESIASLSNGDTNYDGLSDAVENMIGGAKEFVNQMPADTQIGLYEFHREDFDPMEVLPLTSDRPLLHEAIDGIWDNYVQWFPAGSRCWDALAAAIPKLGPTNRDEVHFLVFVSDGRDESSVATMDDVITAATNAGVRVFAIGFGDELDPAPLQTVAAETGGRFYTAATPDDLAWAFAQIGKDFNGQYLLRWATLKRSTNSFMPSFTITYQGRTAMSPPNPVWEDLENPIVDDTTTPPTTNYPLITNIIIAPFIPTEHAAPVTVGALRLVADAAEKPTAVTLRVAYAPRYVRQLRVRYRANFPCTAALRSAGPGEILAGWTMTETSDGEGGSWLHLLSPNPQSLTSSIPFAVMGNLITFHLRDLAGPPTNAFSYIEVDNSLYGTNAGAQRFVIENTNAFVVTYAPLPYGTPVPWLLAHGFTTDFAAAELSDPDGDGVPTWMEYRGNTDPRDAASRFAIRSVARTGPGGRFQIIFASALERTYGVEWSDDLQTWQSLATGLTGTGGDLTVTDSHNPALWPTLFYRVTVE
jgi:hypothetical protein